MKPEPNEYQMGCATYEVHRVFTSDMTVQQVVLEEIITTGKQQNSFDHPKARMV